jgi:DNA polymerase III epsilon subunit-like protein
MMPIKEPIVYFDFETGGVEPKHPSIQLAAVAWDGGVELGAFEQKIAFKESDADPAALAMNHYDRAVWMAEAVMPIMAAGAFAKWLRPYCTVKKKSKAGNDYFVARLAGYNAVAFDAPRLRELFGASFLPAEYPVRDVLQRAVFYFDERPEQPKPENWKLTTVAAFFGIDTTDAHDALKDARMCAELHYKLTVEA